MLTLQEKLIGAVAPFTMETGPIGAFTASHDDPANDALLVTYVSTFIPKQTGERFNPHVSTGVAPSDYLDKMLAEPLHRSLSRLRVRLSTSSARSARLRRNSRNGL